MSNDSTCPSCGHHFRVGFDPAWAAEMRRRRQELGLTLRQVSEHVGYTQVHLSDVERCLRAKPANPVKLARWYEILGFTSDADVTDRPQHASEAVGSPESDGRGENGCD